MIFNIKFHYVAVMYDIILFQKEKAPDECGTVLVCGSTNWDLTGRKNVPKGKFFQSYPLIYVN